MKKIILLLSVLFAFGCNEEKLPTPAVGPPNILLIIADDLGKDALQGFSEGSIKPNTPHIDAIRNNGILFNNCWVYPTCTPTRASIITGKYGYRTNVRSTDDRIKPSETVLQKYISENSSTEYATAIIGKWHLSKNNNTVNPESWGIDHYAGLFSGAVQDYYNWSLTEDAITTTSTDYATQKFTDLAIDWVQQQNKPWFLWLAYNAPHTPFHAPPAQMHSQGTLPAYTNGANRTTYYMAAIEAMDFQIGRLLDSMTEEEKENTVIIFVGDNGTPGQVAQAPFTSSTVKSSLYQGGINTPLFVSGAGVSRTGQDNNLITSTDLFATIAEIAGVSVDEINDSKSFKSLFTQSTTIRDFQYSEINDGTNDLWAISNGSYKLIRTDNGSEEMYDLVNDPYEQNDLLLGTLTSPQSNAKAALDAELSVIRQ
jgi:arylsulfatase A-like enzyme